MKQLTKQSSEAEIKAYFCAVLNLSESDEEFPVNLDDVWPLVYSRKDKAVRALQSNDLFIKGIDYQVLPQNGGNSKVLPQNGEQDGNVLNLLPQNGEQDNKRIKQWGGNNQVTYMLSVPCLEFFIARKVRPVFEVYRKVFHKVAEGNVTPPQPFDISEPIGLEETLQPLSDYMHQVDFRWVRLKKDVVGHQSSDDVRSMYNDWVATYRRMISQLSQLVQYETINKIEGAYFI